jgi:hypothetical protein
MKTLQPVDFKAVAAKGAYVYCYLRENGSPYYVGIASNARRPFERHSCKAPTKQRQLARVLRAGLTWEEACNWEQFYIARYGRKDLGTGILLNQKDGGDQGFKGGKHSEKFKSFIKQFHTGRKVSAASIKKMQAAAVARESSKSDQARKEAARKAVATRRANGHVVSAETRRKMSESMKGKNRTPRSEAQKKAISKALTGRTQSADLVNKRRMGLMLNKAAKYEICPLVYAMATEQERNRVCQRFNRGERGQEALLNAESKRGKWSRIAA